MNSWLTKNWFKLGVLIAMLILTSALYKFSEVKEGKSSLFAEEVAVQAETAKKESADESVLRDQITQIEYEVSFVDHYHESCSGAFWAVQTFNGSINAYRGMEEQGRENIKECAGTQDFVEFVNSLVIEPELSDVKKELIILADLLADFSTAVIIEENPGVDYRNEANEEIPRQKTKVLESIRIVEVEYGL